ncbi:MAG: diguanylate cyclase [Gammaproteobacteria bacterium]
MEKQSLEGPRGAGELERRGALDGARRVLLVSGDEVLRRQLGGQLTRFGLIVSTRATGEGVAAAVAETQPDALVVDIDTLGPHSWPALEAAHAGDAPHPALIVLSADSGLARRLTAVRAGADAYLTKPLDLTRLLDSIESLTADPQAEPFRILVIDDSAELGELHAQILKKAGMDTRVVSDPTEVIAAMDEFNPELILMGVYMGEVGGPELASVIRQYDNYIGTPIVFLSPETNKDKQLSALGRGGDNFLTMPIAAAHLVAAVRTRAERYRALRSFMVRDSLTGLLNHTSLKERLEVELARASRQGTPLSFAMIDLDHFKQVNDRFGHPTGDRVLKSLARLIRQRLRRTDIVGRYGGEEFAVILPDTGLDAAAVILDDLRADFAALHHRAEGVEFQITFSCGVAAYPGFDDAIALNDAADKALYQAKHEGRNRIALAAP